MKYPFFSNKNNFTKIVLVRRRIVNVKNMGALTSNGNFQPNKNKTGEWQNLLGLGYQENDCAERSFLPF